MNSTPTGLNRFNTPVRNPSIRYTPHQQSVDSPEAQVLNKQLPSPQKAVINQKLEISELKSVKLEKFVYLSSRCTLYTFRMRK